MKLEILIKQNLSILIASAILIASVLVGFIIFVNAQIENVTFPIVELGNCENKGACLSYCDLPQNVGVCTDFALKHNLISQKEAKRAKKFVELKEGPGACTTMEQCKTYCNDINNIEECLSFAEREGFMDDDELIEARKVAQVLRSGVQLPGGCQNHGACEAYCNQPENIDECLVFAERAGLMNQEELQEAKKIAQALKGGIKHPGDCSTKDECETYCRVLQNIEECMLFAEEAGLIDSEEANRAREIAPLMALGETPGGCQSRQECEIYCDSDLNIEECIAFAQRVGLASSEEIKRFRATGGKGPGGCDGPKECEAFCNNPDNQQICFEFGKEHGLIDAEQIEHMQESARQIRETFNDAPSQIVDCLNTSVGSNVIEQIKSGALTPGLQISERVRLCFDNFTPSRDEFLDDHPKDFSPDGDFKDTEGLLEILHKKLQNIENFDERVRLEEEIRRIQPGEFRDKPPFLKDEFPRDDFFDAKFCPAMVSVDFCPEGQERIETFSSPECGTYYACSSVRDEEFRKDDIFQGDLHQEFIEGIYEFPEKLTEPMKEGFDFENFTPVEEGYFEEPIFKELLHREETTYSPAYVEGELNTIPETY